MKTVDITKFALAIVIALSYANSFADTSTSTSDSVKQVHVNTQENAQQPTDTSITTNIKAAFLKEKIFGSADMSAFSISVETKDGNVRLSGTADNQTQADNAVKFAKGVEGVKSVSSDVELKIPAAD